MAVLSQGTACSTLAAVQSQKVVTVYSSSEQSLPFGYSCGTRKTQ